MAETITFRPKPEHRAALAAAGGSVTAHIHAALDRYFEINQEEVAADEARTKPARRPRKARQGVPGPPGEPPDCPHPKDKIKTLQYGKQCTECGKMVK